MVVSFSAMFIGTENDMGVFILVKVSCNMRLQELVEFYKTKDEHYCISDNFMKSGYRQKNGEYIEYAKSLGLCTDPLKAEPNQKWHFLESYAALKDSKWEFEYRLLCPELLLWMAEAAGINKKLIMEAEQEAKKIIDNGRLENNEGIARNKAGVAIRKIITWDILKKAINDTV